MASKTENGPLAASIAKDTTKTTTGEIILGKRKEPPLPPIITSTAAFSSSSSSLKTLVDVAFERMFGYSWGTTFDLSSISNSSNNNNTTNNNNNNNNNSEQQMVQIFGPLRTARILNQKWNVAAPPSSSLSSYGNYKDSIIASSSTTTTQRPVYSSSTTTSNNTSNTNCEKDSSTSISRKDKKMRLEEKDYKNIELPKHMILSSVVPSQPTQSAQTTSSTTTTPYNKNSSTSTSTSTSSNLDNVLKQIAGKKQMNTVEKTSKDWEGFKETDQTLQDDLERTAQSKNAYLVKQDFLNRVDQRKFELEKVERDRERSRRAASSTSSSAK